MTDNIEKTLTERGARYGDFRERARITQNIKSAMADSPNWKELDPDKRECLEMIAHKVGRILNGDPDYHDSWHDIVGYAKLVADRLEGNSDDTDDDETESGMDFGFGTYLIDIPDGWRYGFPREYNKLTNGDLRFFLSKYGVQGEELDFALEHVRSWKEN